MWLVALLSLALADDGGYRACCDQLEGGLCPTLIEVLGPGALDAPAPSEADVTGVWLLTCEDGAAHLPAATRRVEAGARPGDVLTPLGDVAATCFSAACNLPARLCVLPGAPARVVACDTSLPAPVDAWRDARLAHPTAVIAGRRVVRAQELPAERERVAPIQVVRAPPAPAPPPLGAPAPSPAPPEPAPAVTAVAPPAPPPVPASAPSSVDRTLPPEPPDPCVVQAHLRQPSIDQVELGDERLVRGDADGALGHYRAALTVNECNAFAWAQIGVTLRDLGDLRGAARALEVATRLMPTHFRAWTDLGQAREALGEHLAAIDAYQEALTLRPGYVPAEAGLRRSVRSR